MLTAFELWRLFLSFVFGWFVLCLSAPTLAQQSPKPQTDNQQANVSESEPRAFVKAYVENQKIRQKYEPPSTNTTALEKSKQIQDQATAELEKSLAKQNLRFENYNRISNLVDSEQLRKKTLKLIAEERKRWSPK